MSTLEELGYTIHTWTSSHVVYLPPMCEVPAGPFLMGSDPQRDPSAGADEQPAHIVNLPTYRIAKYPVTVAEFGAALAANAPELQPPVNWEMQSLHITRPVHALTWHDALAYVRWLASVTDERWRLPSEAEWEKAARGADGRIYPWGDSWDDDRANAIRPDWSDYETRDITSVDTYPAGASPYGALDMVGNVSEWVSTRYEPDQYAYPAHPTDPQEGLVPASEQMALVRGGCWFSPPERLRVAQRSSFSTWDRFDWLIGIRLALGLLER